VSRFDGDVGIGTTAPYAITQIHGAAADVNIGQLWLNTESNAADQGGEITFGSKFGSSSYTPYAGIRGWHNTTSSSDVGGYMSFVTRPTGGNVVEHMRIESTGNIKLTPQASGDFEFLGNRLNIRDKAAYSSGGGGHLWLVANTATSSPITAGMRIGVLEFVACENAGGNLIKGAAIRAYAETNWSLTANRSYLSFWTTPGNDDITERMRITSAGIVELTSTIKIAGGSPADGKVWTATDSNGNGQWETPLTVGTAAMVMAVIFG